MEQKSNGTKNFAYHHSNTPSLHYSVSLFDSTRVVEGALIQFPHESIVTRLHCAPLPRSGDFPRQRDLPGPYSNMPHE